LAKLKLPRVIEQLSNTPKHIIDQAIKDKLNKDKEIKEYAKTKIYEYYLVNSIINVKPLNIMKRSIEQITELLE